MFLNSKLILWTFLGIILVVLILILVITNIFYVSTILKNGVNKQVPLDAESWKNLKNKIDERKEYFLSKNPINLELNFDGTIRRAYLRENKESNKLIIISHGYRSQGLIDYSLIAHYYLDLGFNILVVDHAAHGRSDGKIIGFGIKDYKPLLEWIKLMDERYNHQMKIYLHGISMGANTVLLCANGDLPLSVKGIIADCGYTSAWEEFKHVTKGQLHLPIFPFLYTLRIEALLRAKYDIKKGNTIDTLKEAKVPVLFIHGDNDDFVPIKMTYENYEACISKKELLIIKGASHAMSHEVDPDLYEKKVLEFIRENE